MIDVKPTVLEGKGIRLEPLTDEHHDALLGAATDGRLWELWFTSVPAPDGVRGYISDALAGQKLGHMLPWAVRELERLYACHEAGTLRLNEAGRNCIARDYAPEKVRTELLRRWGSPWMGPRGC